MTPTPSTLILPVVGATSSTQPRLPLSRPAMTTTWSFFLIFERFVPAITLDNLRRERHNLHKILIAQFARHWTKHARADRRSVFLYKHGRVLIEPDVGAIFAPHLFARAHDDGVLHRSFF